MNILITAGDTEEAIDSVRQINHTATGRLGSLIADTFIEEFPKATIFYISSKGAIIPKNHEKFHMIEANNVLGLEKVIKELLSKEKIDIAVHSMAVSDYIPTGAIIKENLVNKLASNKSKEDILEIIDNETIDLLEEKMDSSYEEVFITMKKAPKVIGLFKDIKNLILVGFKLMVDANEEELIDTGYKILLKNNGSFTLANDLKDIDHNKHIGYLIGKDKDFIKLQTKEEIAKEIVKKTSTLYLSRK